MADYKDKNKNYNCSESPIAQTVSEKWNMCCNLVNTIEKRAANAAASVGVHTYGKHGQLWGSNCKMV